MAADTTKPTLVILAAGLGRRYGGLKQLVPVGPGGATMIEYAVYDARQAGFGRVVLVVHPESEVGLRASLGRRLEKHVSVTYALQRPDDLPDGVALSSDRAKPWGTGHAVLAARDVVHGPFAVVNADDFYGADAYAALGGFLRQKPALGVPTYAMVAYALGETLADTGAVARAICRVAPDGRLQEIEEVFGIEKHGPDGRFVDEGGETRFVGGDTPVSMNMWGFTPAVFDQLADGFRGFLRKPRRSSEAEFLIPTVVNDLIRAGTARVTVLPGGGPWCGMTNPQDKERVTGLIREWVAQGRYPEKLWD
ncbi:MAG TPA: NTP transferase domain-containing protein [Phycisphaerae bacterium]|nr:NTP transferase domain-containing protein [Phycisphaerae bacterium]